MKFRPCIDIHNGKVKQIVGSSLTDKNDNASENYISEKDAADHALYYTGLGLSGGHIILLNPSSSPYYEATNEQALNALKAAPGKFQIGGGINPDNARSYLDAGASHVIVTSFVFSGGNINYDNLSRIENTVGRERLVLDLSCGIKNGEYHIATDRWQKFTEKTLGPDLLDALSSRCDEFLVHAVDVEGKASGIDTELVKMLSGSCGIPVTYAGGIGSYEDIIMLKEISGGDMDFTVGSALDIFGGSLKLSEILPLC